MIGRDNQNRIRWGNLLTLPVAQGGLLYVEPVYASPGASDAASSYPRLIRVAMMYNDKVGYGPTVRDALTELFGPGCRRHRDRTCAGEPAERTAARRATGDRRPARGAAGQPGRARRPRCRRRWPACRAGRTDAVVGRQGRGAAGGANGTG